MLSLIDQHPCICCVFVCTDVAGSHDVFCHMAPFLLYNIVYNCGPDIGVCCQFDFHSNKCWSWGKYQDAAKITDDNIHTKSAFFYITLL